MQRLFVLREAAQLAGLIAFLTANWAGLASQGKFLAVSVSLHKSQRSLDQNRRYWGPAVMGRIVEQGWVDGRQYQGEIWHELFKRRFLGLVELPGGAVMGVSSSDLGVEAFGEFMTQVEAYAAQELGVLFD